MFMGGCIYTCYEKFKQKTIPSTQITHLFALRTIQSGLLDTSEARKKYHERISQNTSSYQRVSARVVGSWPPAKSVHKGIISFHDSWPFMLHYYFLFIKYDLHQFSTIPTIPKQSFIMLETLRDKLSQKRS